MVGLFCLVRYVWAIRMFGQSDFVVAGLSLKQSVPLGNVEFLGCQAVVAKSRAIPLPKMDESKWCWASVWATVYALGGVFNPNGVLTIAWSHPTQFTRCLGRSHGVLVVHAVSWSFTRCLGRSLYGLWTLGGRLRSGKQLVQISHFVPSQPRAVQ